MLQHTNPDPKGFLDALAFWDADHGLALGDPVEGRFVILATDDGGKTWIRIPPGGMPAALPGEGAFAASGTCLVVQGDRNAWFGTGAGQSLPQHRPGAKLDVSTRRRFEAGNGTLGHLLAGFLGCRSWRRRGRRFQGARPRRRSLRPHFRRRAHLEASQGIATRRLSLCGHPRTGFTRTDPAGCRPHRRPTGRRRRRELDEAQRPGLPCRVDQTSQIGWAVGENGRIARWNGR